MHRGYVHIRKDELVREMFRDLTCWLKPLEGAVGPSELVLGYPPGRWLFSDRNRDKRLFLKSKDSGPLNPDPLPFLQHRNVFALQIQRVKRR